MFTDIKIKTFSLEDLVNRTLYINKFIDGNSEIIAATDVRTKDIFVLSEKITSEYDLCSIDNKLLLI